uniref:protein-tyrosine-phosphatase PTP1-like n=1 Tax=Erigeron canadensis TaxID=72917 RepID=UPI001CB9A31B|nr:protein-tyrosine-phosphatase PTP1-like [Erigeron canadensis]
MYSSSNATSFDMSTGFPSNPPLSSEQIEYCKHAHRIFKAKRANNEQLIIYEFNILEQKSVRSVSEVSRLSSVAKLPINAIKNRYERVIPFDSNRVTLDQSEDYSSSEKGYINASFIGAEVTNSSEGVSRFIATQGPLPETFNDFWTMVLQKRCPAIVMLTRLVDPPETPMCGDYFQADNGVRLFDNIRMVTKRIVTTDNKLVLRHLEVNYEVESENLCLPVLHIHYPKWPDMGVPKETNVVREIFRRLCHLPSTQVPIVVHCSAGIGRTGTYCAIHNTIQRILIGDMSALDLAKTIRTFRDQRIGMVQNLEQYIFCFKAIIEELEDLVPTLKSTKND